MSHQPEAYMFSALNKSFFWRDDWSTNTLSETDDLSTNTLSETMFPVSLSDLKTYDCWAPSRYYDVCLTSEITHYPYLEISY